MKPSVYLDATVPSFYFEDRPATILQAWREITVEFWDQATHRYELYLATKRFASCRMSAIPMKNGNSAWHWSPR
jgi:hypothetical protein